MRFKNLTITITLGCLSIVALAGLVMLPISNGVCEWSGDERSKNFYVNSVHLDKKANPNNPDCWSSDTKAGRGWHLSATLYASFNKAKGEVSPSIYGEKAFDADSTLKFSGTANVRAWHSAVEKVRTTYCTDNQNVRPGGCYHICWGHQVKVPVEAGEENNWDQGEEQTIVTAVTAQEVAMMTEVHRTETDGSITTLSGGIAIDIKEVVGLSFGASHAWTGEDGLAHVGKYSRTVTRYREDPEEHQSQSEEIVVPNGASSGAETFIYFQSVSDSNSVEYSPINTSEE